MPRRKLLLADDSITIQKVVNLTFADEGIDVVTVGDGNSAMEMLRDESPDIVLADVNMPGLTGYELCSEVKGRSFEDQVPVVLLVGSFEPFDEDEADRVGADGYLTKPFQSINQLVSMVGELLGDEAEGEDELADTAEMPQRETLAAGADQGATDPEPFVPSFPDPFEGLLSKSEPALPVEKEVSEQVEEPSDFRDADEFEMSEAFGDDDNIEEVSASDALHESTPIEASDDSQIEEVSDDFLRTQPFTESDLQEISIDSEVEIDAEALEIPIEHSEDHPFSPVALDGEQGGGETEESEPVESTDPVFRVDSTDEFDPETQFKKEDGPDVEIADESGSVVDFRTFDQEELEIRKDPVEPLVEEIHPVGEVSEDAEEESADAPDLPEPEAASALNLDEINLLELPPVDVEVEEEEPPVGYLDPTSSVEPPVVSEETHTISEKGYSLVSDPVEDLKSKETDVPEQQPQRETQRETESDENLPSKALVETITRRVIETLSEKAIREIAWEVVPDMADLIIKKMAEDKMKK